ncbi:Uncharacterized protein SCF082_LOCUS34474 [Durusdinium trenchii]|uniref:Glycosyltransferase family 25 protein n=1 Tax=Durusdinium trenchii TaxID=1381693 RepID=A0ABP0P0A5_9DINO
MRARLSYSHGWSSRMPRILSRWCYLGRITLNAAGLHGRRLHVPRVPRVALERGGLTGTATRSRPRTVGTPAFGVVSGTRSSSGRLKAFYINTDLDDARRTGLEATCQELELDCERVVPPKLSSPEVQRCVDETPLRSFECSLVHAHRGILQRIEGGSTGHALVLEDDARLNRKISSTQAQELLMGQFERNFVMLGWCEPSCAHAYLVSPQGASMLLSRGFDRPKLPADAMFPAFATEDVLFPEQCPGGYPGDIGLLCQDRSTPHCKSYSYY